MSTTAGGGDRAAGDEEYALVWGPDESSRRGRRRAETTADESSFVGVGALIGDEPSPLSEMPDRLSSHRETLSFSRRRVRVVQAVAVLVVGALVVLWQRAESRSDSLDVAGGNSGSGTEEQPTEVTEVADGPDRPDAGAQIEVLESDLAAMAEVVVDLEAELAATVPPALPGTALRRIIVAADARMLSLGNEGLAVIGPFGGYAAVDPTTNTVTATAQVAGGATRVMRTNAAVWITNYLDDEIVRIDPVADRVVSTFAFPGPDGVAKLGPTLAVASFDEGIVAQVDPADGEILQQVAVGGQPSDVLVADDDATIWVAVYDTGEVVRIDTSDFSVGARIVVGAGPVGLTLIDDVLWVVNGGEGSVAAVDTVAMTMLRTVPVGAGPTAAAGYAGSVWVSVTAAGELVQLDPETAAVLTRTPLGSSTRGGPSGLAVGAGSLWVAMQGERSVVRITVAAS